jgi:hypothetical protein
VLIHHFWWLEKKGERCESILHFISGRAEGLSVHVMSINCESTWEDVSAVFLGSLRHEDYILILRREIRVWERLCKIRIRAGGLAFDIAIEAASIFLSRDHFPLDPPFFYKKHKA